MSWVLVVLFLRSNGWGSNAAAATSVDFSSQEKCEIAAKTIEKQAEYIHALCFQK